MKSELDTLTAPRAGQDFASDCASFGAFWNELNQMLAALPPKKERSAAQQSQAQALLASGRESREAFLRQHAKPVYERVTQNRSRFMRLDALMAQTAIDFPGLVPAAALLEKENGLLQSEKEGHEVDQGIYLCHVLADADCGRHLCHALLLPHPDSAQYLDTFRRTGKVDLGTVLVERRGTAGYVFLKNSRYLNAEDDGTCDNQEIAVDLLLMDEQVQAGVLRGEQFTSGKYQGRRVYSTGINLTHLYNGKISYLWYMKREMGWMNKVFRGLASPDRSPDEVLGQTLEKPWISAIEAFAIGGGCQYTLVTDINLAEKSAYMTLPAKKEGIVPGAANLRLPRFVGDRIARQAVMMELRIDCDSPAGHMICDRIVEDGQMDAAIDDVIEGMNRSGVVSAGSNRRAFRVAHEPLDLFRNYMATYAREQAYCHFSPALISNLERFWDAANRKI